MNLQLIYIRFCLLLPWMGYPRCSLIWYCALFGDCCCCCIRMRCQFDNLLFGIWRAKFRPKIFEEKETEFLLVAVAVTFLYCQQNQRRIERNETTNRKIWHGISIHFSFGAFLLDLRKESRRLTAAKYAKMVALQLNALCFVNCDCTPLCWRTKKFQNEEIKNEGYLFNRQ